MSTRYACNNSVFSKCIYHQTYSDACSNSGLGCTGLSNEEKIEKEKAKRSCFAPCFVRSNLFPIYVALFLTLLMVVKLGLLLQI